jgi:hypothetical protein
VARIQAEKLAVVGFSVAFLQLIRHDTPNLEIGYPLDRPGNILKCSRVVPGGISDTLSAIGMRQAARNVAPYLVKVGRGNIAPLYSSVKLFLKDSAYSLVIRFHNFT